MNYLYTRHLYVFLSVLSITFLSVRIISLVLARTCDNIFVRTMLHFFKVFTKQLSEIFIYSFSHQMNISFIVYLLFFFYIQFQNFLNFFVFIFNFFERQQSNFLLSYFKMRWSSVPLFATLLSTFLLTHSQPQK